MSAWANGSASSAPALPAPLDENKAAFGNLALLRTSVAPALATLPVLADGNRRQSGCHSVGVQHAVKVIDLVGDQACSPSIEDRYAPLAVYVLVLDVERERAVHHATHIEEAEAPWSLGIIGSARAHTASSFARFAAARSMA